jgi:hypothetical protein
MFNVGKQRIGPVWAVIALAYAMTTEDTEKLLTITHNALKAKFGLMGDLPYEFANTVANIYFRFFQQGMNSAPTISSEERSIRLREYEKIAKIVEETRVLMRTCNDHLLINVSVAFIIDVCKYRMQNADKKTGIHRMIERKFLPHQDIPDLVKGLQLYE